MTKAGPDLFVFKQRGLHRAADLGAVGDMRRRSTASRLSGGADRCRETLFYFVMDVGLFRSRDRCATWTPVKVPWKERCQPSMSCSPVAR